MLVSTTLATVVLAAGTVSAHPLAAPGKTTLTDDSIAFAIAEKGVFALERGDVTAVIVDNSAVDTRDLPGHRAGYNGVASLSHKNRRDNLFVPTYAGLNLEHIHDGTLKVEQEIFEPRRAAMQLRIIDPFTVELYQPPTPNWKLESCGRYQILPDGTLEYTFECIPRADLFEKDYIGLFWASYINRPEEKAIQFRGQRADRPRREEWIRAVTPRHGVESTHPPAGPLPEISFTKGFPLTLAFNHSKYVYTEPWYFGVSHDMAYVLMFRARDGIWFAQSPTGGGSNNPAWDFQGFIPDYKVDEAYGFVMRAAYIPYESPEQVERDSRRHREALDVGS
jgi:hypothetical protein